MTQTQKQALDLSWVDGYIAGFSAARRNRPSIAQSIRDAAINWPQYLGDVECEILYAFCRHSFEHFYFKDGARFGSLKEKYQARTFMLLVAESLI